MLVEKDVVPVQKLFNDDKKFLKQSFAVANEG